MDDVKKLSRNISLIENQSEGFEQLLLNLPPSDSMVIGITGAPGSGKSTLSDGLISEMVKHDKKVAVLCVDPSSPFHRGALLGDRIRMSEWYNVPGVFIRSLASRGSLGGLNPMIIEIAEYVRSAGFDYVIIETVGVGQSEVDIAALADITIVVLVPEGGDSIQSMKAGLMEIADVFVVNKSDRPGADTFYNDLKKMIGPLFIRHEEMKPIFKVTASERKGIERLYDYISATTPKNFSDQKINLLAAKVITMVQNQLTKNINAEELKRELQKQLAISGKVNLFEFSKKIAEANF